MTYDEKMGAVKVELYDRHGLLIATRPARVIKSAKKAYRFSFDPPLPAGEAVRAKFRTASGITLCEGVLE